jgi:7-carboxy-7-deazaguanine synthase
MLLIKGLLKLKKTISVETNGAVSIKNIPVKIKKVVDVKTPSTGYQSSFKKDNIKYLTAYDEVKFVISNKADFEFAEKFIHKNGLNKIGCAILMSPNLSKKGLANELVNWILKSNEKYIFQPQLHKLIKEEPIYLIKRL